MTLASDFSLLIKASTESTIIPALRADGSSTRTNCICGVKLIFKESAAMVSIGFFFAFIMLGNVAYLGSFNRKSAVITVGNVTLILSLPLSVSLSARISWLPKWRKKSKYNKKKKATRFHYSIPSCHR